MTERALDAARAGGRHAGWLKRYGQLPSHLIEKAVRSLDKQIERHSQWVAHPHTKLPRSYPAEGVRALVSRKWPMDIARLQEQRDILMVLLQERASHEEKQR
ncbi:MAG: hypothetical protein ACREXX_14595 [Gammaproteobacteria bacterium]